MNIKTQFKNIVIVRSFLALVVLVLLALNSFGTLVLAQAVLQGYKSDQTLQRGMLVTLNKDDQTKVEAVTDETFENVKGVVADQNDSPVTISSQDQNVFVAASGRYEVLVSNENGAIKPGDYLSGSSLDGIAMKAGDSHSVVVGRAAGSFQGGGDSIGGSSKDGRTIEFGRIQADIGIGKNPLQKPPVKDTVLDTLQEVASTIAGKSVSPLRIYLSFILLLITASVAGAMLISGVRSAVISLGRNPLSKNIILKGMLQVLILSLIIFITGLFGVYLLIKL